MLSVTYSQLTGLDDSVLTKVQRFTGNQLSYGLNTPIAILDIINHVGLETGILCLTQVPGSDSIQRLVALEAIKSCYFVWEAIKPGDIYLTMALSLLEMSTQNTDLGPKLDYCGDPIPGFTGTVSTGQVANYISAMQAYVDTMPDTNVAPTYSFWMGNGAPWTQAAIDWNNERGVGRWTLITQDMNKFDPCNMIHVSGAPGDYPSYIEANYRAKLLLNYSPGNLDPEWFLRQSFIYDTLALHDNTNYGVIVHQSMNGTSDIPNWLKVSAQMMVDATQLLTNMLLSGYGDLEGLITILLNILTNYTDFKRIELLPTVARLNDMRHGTFPYPTYTSQARVSAAEQQTVAAGEIVRRSSLQDYLYVGTFSSNGTTINESDRNAMELDIRTKMLNARKAVAQALYDEALTEYASLTSISSGLFLVDGITPYLL